MSLFLSVSCSKYLDLYLDLSLKWDDTHFIRKVFFVPLSFLFVPAFDILVGCNIQMWAYRNHYPYLYHCDPGRCNELIKKQNPVISIKALFVLMNVDSLCLLFDYSFRRDHLSASKYKPLNHVNLQPTGPKDTCL